jgi:hypothetical protein
MMHKRFIFMLQIALFLLSHATFNKYWELTCLKCHLCNVEIVMAIAEGWKLFEIFYDETFTKI